MRILIAYATSEGQTAKIADRLAEFLMSLSSLAPECIDIGESDDLNPSDYDGVILAASVHMGRYQKDMVSFVKDNREALKDKPVAFISVSMGEAAVENPENSPELREKAREQIAENLSSFFEKVDWRPDEVFPVAGALMYSKYGFITRWIMKKIAEHEGASTDTSKDHEYTDWAALEHFAKDYVGKHFPAQAAG